MSERKGLQETQKPTLTMNVVRIGSERVHILKLIEEDQARFISLKARISQLESERVRHSAAIVHYERSIKLSSSFVKSIRIKIQAFTQVSNVLARCEDVRKATQPTRAMSPSSIAYQNSLLQHEQHVSCNTKERENAQGELKDALHRNSRLRIELEATRFKLVLTNKEILTLKGLRKGLERTINEKREAVAAWKRIPTELWIHIFKIYVIETEEEHMKSLSVKPPYAVLKLGMVCGLWRQIALDVPSLWVYIPVACKGNGIGMPDDRIAWYEERRKSKPLIGYSFRTKRRPSIQNSRKVIQYPKFTALYLNVNHLDHQSGTALLRGISSALKVTDLRLIDNNNRIVALGDQDLTSLTSITCTNTRLLRVIENLQTPLKVRNGTVKTVSFSSGNFSIQDCLYFIAAQNALETLIIRLPPASVVSNFTNHRFSFSSLSTIECDIVTMCDIFTDLVILPALHHVVLVDNNRTFPEILHLWGRFLSIHRRAWNITHLTIKDAETPHPALSSDSYAIIILDLPNLTHLQLMGNICQMSLHGLLLRKLVPPLLRSLTLIKSEISPNLVLNFLGNCMPNSLNINFIQCPQINSAILPVFHGLATTNACVE